MAYDSEYAFALDPSEVVDASIAADPWSASPDVGISNHIVSAQDVHFGSTDGHTSMSTTGTTAVPDSSHSAVGTSLGSAVANAAEAVVGAATMGAVGVSATDATHAAATQASRTEALIPIYGSDASEVALNAAYAYPSDFDVATPTDHAAPAGLPRIEDHPDYNQFTIDIAPAAYDGKGGAPSYDAKGGGGMGAGAPGTGDGGTGLVAHLKDPTIIVNHDALTGGFDDMINQLANIYHRPMIHNPITNEAIYAQRGVDDDGYLGAGGLERDDVPAVTREDFDTLLHSLTVHSADFPTLYNYLAARAYDESIYNRDLYLTLSPDDAMERQLRYFADMMRQTVENPFAYFQSELDRIAYRMGYDNNQNFQGAEIQSILQAAFKYMPEAQINKIVEDAFKRGAKDKAKKKSSGWKKWLGAIVGIALAWTGVGAAIGAAITSATGVAGALSGIAIGNVTATAVVNGVVGSTIIGGVLNGGDFGAAFRGAAIGGLGAVAGGFAGALTDNVISAVNPSGVAAAFDGASGVATAAINTGAAATALGSYVQTGVQVLTTTALNHGNTGQALLQAGVAAGVGGLVGQIDGVSQNIQTGLGNLAGQLVTGHFDAVSAASAFMSTGPSRTDSQGPLFDDDGNLMPGASRDLQTQYDNLLRQGLTPAQASGAITQTIQNQRPHQLESDSLSYQDSDVAVLESGSNVQSEQVSPPLSDNADSNHAWVPEVLFDDQGYVLPSAPLPLQEAYNILVSQGLNRPLSFEEIQFIQQYSRLSETGMASMNVDVASTNESIAVYEIKLQDPQKDLIYTLNYRTDLVGKIVPNDDFTKAYEGMTAAGLNSSQTFDLLVSIGPRAFNELSSLGATSTEAIEMMMTLKTQNQIRPEGFPDSIANAVRPLQILSGADGKFVETLTGTIFQSPTSEGTKYYISFSAHGLNGGGEINHQPGTLSGFLRGPNGEMTELGTDIIGSVILSDGSRLEVPFEHVVSGIEFGSNGYSTSVGNGRDFVISEVPKEFAEKFVNSTNPKDIPILATASPEVGQTVYSNGAPAYAGDPENGIYRMVATVATVTKTEPTYFLVSRDDIAGNGLPGGGSSGQIIGWVAENGQAVIGGFNQAGLTGQQTNLAVPIVADPSSRFGFQTGNVVKR